MRFLFTVAAAGSVLLGRSAEASRLTPPVLPLIVRNPYLSAWLGDVRENPWNKWPMFWTGEEVCAVPSWSLRVSKLDHSNSHGLTLLVA